MTDEKRMLAPGHMLDDRDIEILLSCYRKSHGTEAANNIAVTPAVCDQNSSPFQTMMDVNWNQLQSVDYPRKWVIPLKIPGFAHWNVIEITQDDDHNIFCRQFDTNGFSYPVRGRQLAEIRDFFNSKIPNCEIRTQANRSKKVYRFGLQENNNCGIVAASIIHDIEANRMPHHSENKILSHYGGNISRSHRNSGRNIMKNLVMNYGDESQKRDYCLGRGIGGSKISGGNYYAYGNSRPSYNRDNSEHKAIYEGFQKDEETLVRIIRLINNHKDNDFGILSGIRGSDEICDKAKFIFKNPEYPQGELKEGWMDIAINVLKEKLKEDSEFSKNVKFIFVDDKPETRKFKTFWRKHFTRRNCWNTSHDDRNGKPDELDSTDIIVVSLCALVIGALVPINVIAIVVATVLAIVAICFAIDWFDTAPYEQDTRASATSPNSPAAEATSTGPRSAVDFKPVFPGDSKMDPEDASSEETKEPGAENSDGSSDESYENASEPGLKSSL